MRLYVDMMMPTAAEKKKSRRPQNQNDHKECVVLQRVLSVETRLFLCNRYDQSALSERGFLVKQAHLPTLSPVQSRPARLQGRACPCARGVTTYNGRKVSCHRATPAARALYADVTAAVHYLQSVFSFRGHKFSEIKI